MSDLTNISDFTYGKGLGLGKDYQNLTYLYGLSDFWQVLFQDTATNNLLLEATSTAASDIYSHFLQLCTGISIADIAESASSQLRLEIISTSLSLPTNISISNGSWSNGFTTLSVGDVSKFVVGDTIEVKNSKDTLIYSTGGGVNVEPLNEGGLTYVSSGAGWNGIFTISSVLPDGKIQYYQPVSPGPYTHGAVVSTIGIGIETYQLPEKVVSSRFLTNKPFLPTITLEENVDYFIDQQTSRISFARPIAEYGFPSRVTATGNEYSIWFVDVRYDEDLIYAHFPKLLGRTLPAFSNADYRNFLYGLYYIYTSGPTLSIISKGINLALGVPLARDAEVVLEMRPHVNTGQYIVITDLNSYLTPKGLTPSVVVGQQLKVGDELAKWVDILDYTTDGAWWRVNNPTIPAEIMPIAPVGYDRLVTGRTQYFTGYELGTLINQVAINSGDAPNQAYSLVDYGDWIMTNYLKNNTFLVRVNVTEAEFTAVQKFESIYSLLLDLKPSYTYPLYVYSGLYTKVLRVVGANSLIRNVVQSSAIGLLGEVVTSALGWIQGGLVFGTVSGTSSVSGFMTGLSSMITGVSSICSVQDFWTYGFVNGTSATIGISNVAVNGTPDLFPFNNNSTITSVGSLTASIV